MATASPTGDWSGQGFMTQFWPDPVEEVCRAFYERFFFLQREICLGKGDSCFGWRVKVAEVMAGVEAATLHP